MSLQISGKPLSDTENIVSSRPSTVRSNSGMFAGFAS